MIPSRTKDITGLRFGNLTVVSFVPRTGSLGGARWLCKCDCGSQKVVLGGNLRSGGTKTCGCSGRELQAQKVSTHGMTGSDSYSSWASMKSRCLNPNDSTYDLYGGRGITIHSDWLGPTGFETFLSDMGPRPAKSHTLDRINVDGNYEPGNCRWATPVEQGRNRRTNRLIEFSGRKQCLSAWAAEFGISRKVLRDRLVSGWSMERALSTPLKKWTKRKALA